MNKRYEYTLKDHLGNARLCLTDANNNGSAEILQQTHYYPLSTSSRQRFGLPIPELSATFDGATNNYQYNNKELNEDFGLHWSHHEYRFLDLQINR